MATTHVAVFDTTLQKTHEWLSELVHIGRFEDESQAYTALRAVLHALRDRLIVAEAADLAAQMPMLIRGFYYEGWSPSKAPTRERTVEAFLDHVRTSLRNANFRIDAEPAVRAVFALLADRISRGEIEDVRHMLPAEVRDLWPLRG